LVLRDALADVLMFQQGMNVFQITGFFSIDYGFWSIANPFRSE